MACLRQYLALGGEYAILVADLAALLAAPEAAPAEIVVACATAALMINSCYELADCLEQAGEHDSAQTMRAHGDTINQECNDLKARAGI